MQTFGDVTFQYVSIVKRIRLLLENTDLLKIASDYKPSEDGLMRDFHDGYFCKNNALLSAHSTLRIVLYIDDFEVSNPLGPKATFFVLFCALVPVFNFVYGQRVKDHILADIFMCALLTVCIYAYFFYNLD